MRIFDKQEFFRKRYMWIAFLAAFLFRLLFLFNTHTLSIAGDEIFAMWPAAKLAGYNWGQVMQNYRYYGYGYSALLVPFFLLCHNSLVLYRCLVLLMILVQSLIAPVCCHIMKTYLDVDNEKVLCLSGIACSYMVTVRAVYTYPEFIYILVFWLCTWILMKLEKNREQKREKIIYTIILILALIYALSVHTRAAAIWMALAGTVLFYAWVYRKCLVSVPVFLGMGGAGYLIGKKGMRLLLRFLGHEGGGTVGNTSVGFSFGIFGYLRDPHSWTAWLNIIMGQLNEAVINTGGLAVGVVVVMLLLLWRSVCRKTEIIENKGLNYRPYITAGVFCILAVAITIGGQSLTGLLGVVNAMEGGDPDSFRAVTYFRYYVSYAGPLLMLGIAFFFHKPQALQWVKGKVLVIAGILQVYWVFCILPLLFFFNGCVWSYAPYSFTRGFADEIGARSYLPGTVMVAAILLVSFYLCKKKRYMSVLGLLCVILIYSYGYNAVFHEGYRGNLNYQYTESGREILYELERQGLLPEQIYVEDTSVPLSGQSVACLYQFYLLDTPVCGGIPETDEENVIFICYQPEEYRELLKEGYMQEYISEQETLYIKGDNLVQAVEKIRTGKKEQELSKIVEKQESMCYNIEAYSKRLDD